MRVGVGIVAVLQSRDDGDDDVRLACFEEATKYEGAGA